MCNASGKYKKLFYRQCLSLEKHDNAQSLIISSTVLTLNRFVLECYIARSMDLWLLGAHLRYRQQYNQLEQC